MVNTSMVIPFTYFNKKKTSLIYIEFGSCEVRSTRHARRRRFQNVKNQSYLSI